MPPKITSSGGVSLELYDFECGSLDFRDCQALLNYLYSSKVSPTGKFLNKRISFSSFLSSRIPEIPQRRRRRRPKQRHAARKWVGANFIIVGIVVIWLRNRQRRRPMKRRGARKWVGVETRAAKFVIVGTVVINLRRGRLNGFGRSQCSAE